jgi:peptidoglycan/xylan/chitin deacetylase (PgdA/CDA1 family)
MTPLPARPQVAVHVDLDGASDIFRAHGWSYRPGTDPVFDSGLEAFLDFFAEYGVRATLFVIAQDVKDPHKRQLLDRAAAAGHEIASHSVTHQHLTKISSAQKRMEIFDSRALLEDAFGVPVVGFRAPGYLLDRECLELLAEAGYQYDSSASATRAHAERLQLPIESLAAPGRPLPGSDLIEWPMPDPRPSPVPFSPSYSLLLGTWFFRWGLRKNRIRGDDLALLYHLIDLAAPLPAGGESTFAQRFWTLSVLSAEAKRRRCRAMLEAALREYTLTTTRSLVDAWRAAGHGPTVAPGGTSA